MAFNENLTVFQSLNILESEIGLVTKTRTAVSGAVEISSIGGKSIVKAGSLFTGTNEYGVVFEDYDITGETAYPISVIFAGRVRADRVSDNVTAKKSDLAAVGLYLITVPAPHGATGATGSTGSTGATGATS